MVQVRAQPDLVSLHQNNTTRRVTIVYRIIPHYRVAFYNGLRDRLREQNVDLRLMVGRPIGSELSRADTVDVGWSEPLPRRHAVLPGGRVRMEWQGVLTATKHDDLVIVEDAVRLASNGALIGRRVFERGPMVALWGHGADLQSGDGRLKGLVRRAYQRNADWYFAYTEEVVERVTGHGVARDRTTNVMNTIDTDSFLGALAQVTDVERDAFRQRIGAGSHAPIGLYCGGLIAEKRLPFLLEAGRRIVEQQPDFRLVVIGSGPLQPMIESAAATRPWLHYLGPQFGTERATAFATSDLVLMPGLVGLVVVDAQLAGCPVVTVADARHSPEIAYLDHDVTGLVLPRDCSSDAYADGVVRLLTDGARLAMYRAAGRAKAGTLTTDQMVDRFATGVLSILETPPAGGSPIRSGRRRLRRLFGDLTLWRGRAVRANGHR